MDGAGSEESHEQCGRRRARQGPASYSPSIEEKYGRPVGEWLDMVRRSPLDTHMQVVSWLATEHGLGHGHANALVAHVRAERS
ncbi:DUF4287 domain-containing protein [Blastococcus saxobsidens]|uniref:Uncharacterized protein DUF4287 n=1 Tax=Blastococcus saxobsidens TaxID=138336 RepID=A0A4Q7Y6Y6_9ACTN|nr:DUF4287 domain-containing protein [Blastococcus saxobsidens]RZU31715.1 uncharacterized protein DUF4287 [Blastococcus saxobsidens]